MGEIVGRTDRSGGRQEWLAAQFEAHRSRLRAVAYRTNLVRTRAFSLRRRRYAR